MPSRPAQVRELQSALTAHPSTMLHRLSARTPQLEGPQLVCVSTAPPVGETTPKRAVLASDPSDVVNQLGLGGFKGHISLLGPMCNSEVSEMLDSGCVMDVWSLLAALRCGFCESQDHATVECTQRAVALQLGIVRYDCLNRLCLYNGDFIFLEAAGVKLEPSVKAMIRATVGALGTHVINSNDEVRHSVELLASPSESTCAGIIGGPVVSVVNTRGEEVHFPSLYQTMVEPLCSSLKSVRHMLGTSLRWPAAVQLDDPILPPEAARIGECRFCDCPHSEMTCQDFWVALRLGVVKCTPDGSIIAATGEPLGDEDRPFRRCQPVLDWTEQAFGLSASDNTLFKNIALSGLLLEVPWLYVWYAVMKSDLYFHCEDPLEHMARNSDLRLGSDNSSCGTKESTQGHFGSLYSRSDTSLDTFVTAPSECYLGMEDEPEAQHGDSELPLPNTTFINMAKYYSFVCLASLLSKIGQFLIAKKAARAVS